MTDVTDPIREAPGAVSDGGRDRPPSPDAEAGAGADHRDLAGVASPSRSALRAFCERHWQMGVNLLLFVALGHYAVTRALAQIRADAFSFVEVAFAVHNVVGLTIVLIRQDHRAIETRLWPQVVALFAFFSGIAFVTTPAADATLLQLARGATLLSIGLGIAAFISLGRSFGILIAVRQVRSGGVYGWVRHPMYLSDIIMRVGFILKNACSYNVLLFVISTAAYLYRAVLEEEFLGRYPEYREYRERVRYRMVPGLF